MSNERYLGEKASSFLLNEMINPNSDNISIDEPDVILTKREIEIIKLIASDKNNPDISNLLNISLRTVETHRRNIMQKINVNSVVALVRYAVKHKIVFI